MEAKELRLRYWILISRDGRPYLYDGSNFVCWLSEDDDVEALIDQDVARKEQYVRNYIEGMQASRNVRHANCDHAYGICVG